MQLIPVTICTDRKRSRPEDRLLGRNLAQGSQAEVAVDWLERVTQSERRVPAMQVYCGRSFTEAVAAARGLGTELQIISTGLGLIQATSQIPSYSLSIAPRGDDYVGSKILNEPFDAAHWWRSVNAARSEQPLSDLLSRNPGIVIGFALSRSYLDLIAHELAQLTDEHLRRIRIFGLSIDRYLDDRVRPCVIPYDNRLDGGDSPIVGTRGDFAQRALRHFAEVVWPGAETESAEKHAERVNSLISNWARAPKFNRTQKTDDEVRELIRDLWQSAAGRSSLMLRMVRDEQNIACEQSRFKRLFHEVAEQVQE